MVETLRPKFLLEIEERHVARFGYGAQDVVAWLAERDYGMKVWRQGGWRTVTRVTDDMRNYLFVPR